MKMTLSAPFACRSYPFSIHGPSKWERPYLGVNLSFLARWLSWDPWCSEWERPYLRVTLFVLARWCIILPSKIRGVEDVPCSLCHLTIEGSFCVVCCRRGAVSKSCWRACKHKFLNVFVFLIIINLLLQRTFVCHFYNDAMFLLDSCSIVPVWRR